MKQQLINLNRYPGQKAEETSNEPEIEEEPDEEEINDEEIDNDEDEDYF